ncbi:benzoate/H(+) symporter BenE family transporter [Paludibacterium paludis]|uniref:Benzoate transporter n=1 Tax=Paludibacterium paludis TaxID=1225769 RepID=A0A918P1U9_9NEIS|nr:benzoate/H(+) symporter BenE family transporter [Paludibacterium paludis]GGY13457.1 benzoate transporter [Paludibacterium paludis]
MGFFRDISLSAVVAGFVTVLVGFTSSAVIVFQAAEAAGADAAVKASWMWALGWGMGLTCILPSLRYRMPVVTAWSTPGAAVLLTAMAGVSLAEATGAFMVSGLLIALCGFSGVFEKAMKRIPPGLASGMLAGVLVRFGMNVFTAMQGSLALVLPMFAAYLVMRRYRPRYAIPVVLLLGTIIAAWQGSLHADALRMELASPVLVMPSWSVSALIGVALPLFMVTMASQNVPGVAVIRASGFAVPVSPVIGVTGLVSLALAPFGAFALNLAAITAAICMGEEAHPERARRYVAAVMAGVFYCLIGVFGAAVASLFAAFPAALISAVAGLALLGTIGNGLATALHDPDGREAALVTFLVTASGMTLFGVGSAFWGLIAGVTTLLASRLPALRAA